jgi:hypothetical protein
MNNKPNTDHYRRLGVGEKILWGDSYMHNSGELVACESCIGELVHEDDTSEFYRPLAPEPAMYLEMTTGSASVQPKAKTDDSGKPPLSQVPWAAVREMAHVQAYGHQKYNDFYNYRKGMEISRNISCAFRHLADFMDGIDNDPESGRSHLGHALTRIAFVVQNLKDGTAIDDRYRAPNA